jgi:hypothetical protein
MTIVLRFATHRMTSGAITTASSGRNKGTIRGVGCNLSDGTQEVPRSKNEHLSSRRSGVVDPSPWVGSIEPVPEAVNESPSDVPAQERLAG